ncbi:hypothetical protein [uncultured Phenylobacterium sp.]|uniref:hypothetical protein n=1 Tax=uncultured Phenylobacterium sp. TaxID=349273 RepID=UPI0025CBC838|nr:hypothetical protein [uncultured Phenylobacterium sp.]
MSRIDRIRQTVSARQAARAAEARADEAREARATSNLPVPAGPVTPARSFRDDPPRRRDSELDAQLLGQDGQRRGLRGGATILDTARIAYNRTEWSGSYDRRARKGRQARTDI